MPLHSNKIPKHIRESLIIPDKAHFYHKMIIINSSLIFLVPKRPWQ